MPGTATRQVFQVVCTATVATLASVAVLASALPAWAAEYEVKMLDHGPDGMMRYDPQLLKIAPGDSVNFVATDKDHNVETISGMLPDGAKPFSSQTGQDYRVTLTVPGVYGYRCTPHGSLGMVGLIVVGPPVNEQSAKDASVPGMAHRVFVKLFDTLDSQRTARN